MEESGSLPMSSADTTSTIDDVELLGADRILDALAEAGDDDFFDLRGSAAGGLILRQRGVAARHEEDGATRRRLDLVVRTALGRLRALAFLL